MSMSMSMSMTLHCTFLPTSTSTDAVHLAPAASRVLVRMPRRQRCPSCLDNDAKDFFFG
jgi:hypothetical protein